MRVVIFSGTGNVGTALVRRLAGSAHDVCAVARRTPTAPDHVADGVAWVRADITTDDLDTVVAGADVVVHLAWTFQPIRDPDRTWRTNVIGTERILAAVERARTPALVYSSSIAAYSSRIDGRPVDESFATHGSGVSSYAREKAYVERLLDAFELRNDSTRTVRIRSAFVFQHDAAAEQWRLFIANPRLRRLFDSRLIPVAPLPGDLLIQAVHATDLTEAYVAAIEGGAVGAYNVAADDVLDSRAVASLLDARPVSVPATRLRSVIGAAWSAHASKAPPDLFDTLMKLPVMSTQRAKDDLGWRPRTTAAQAIGAFLDGTRRRAVGPTPPLAEQASNTTHASAASESIAADTNKDELYRLAQRYDIAGRSSMSKQQLLSALRETGHNGEDKS